MVALGEKVAGLMGHDEPVAALQAAAATSGEMLWHLPLPEESRAAVLESKVADVLQANWVRWGGRCTPAPSSSSSSARPLGPPRHRRPRLGVQRVGPRARRGDRLRRHDARRVGAGLATAGRGGRGGHGGG